MRNFLNNDFYSIPIFIISYNRTETLNLCLNKFLADGYKNIVILDNHSTDEKHIDFLKGVPVKVCWLKKNYGPKVLWECGLFNDLIEHEYYVLTDPDVLPIKNSPGNYIEKFYKILRQYPEKTKVGFSLKLDDLPEDYIYKWDIIRFESFYWQKKLSFEGMTIYDAPIDTTFALYRPGITRLKKNFYDGIRTGYPYVARHLGWYIDSYGQNSYYKESKIYSTSNQLSAIINFRKSVVEQSVDLYFAGEKIEPYRLLRLVFKKDFIQEKMSWMDIFRAISYLIRKKSEKLLMINKKGY